MSVQLFIAMFTIGSAVSSLLTEAVKKAYSNAGKEYSANVVALINAIVVGCGGTAVMYMLMAIPWTVNNILCLVLMGVAVWIASMVGYDKVIQMLNQLKEEKKDGNESTGERISRNDVSNCTKTGKETR